MQDGTGGAGGGVVGIIIGLIPFIIAIFFIASMWKVFTKAGQPGWAVIVPVYNIFTLLKIVGKPGWWIVLFFIPLVSIIIAILVSLELAKNFGKGAGFGVGLAFLPFIFFPVLGFGSAEYTPVEA